MASIPEETIEAARRGDFLQDKSRYSGDFFMVRATPEDENFQSLPKDMAQKYTEKFKYPERFVQRGQDITAIPFKPVQKEKER